MNEWMKECMVLVEDYDVWRKLQSWSWAEAYVSNVPPHTAVRFALLDTLAPKVGEMEQL